MTHAESQDLLLDLAYGELDAARAAELQGHLDGCADCQREKAAIDETRRMAAPLSEQEEPSAGFDDRILAASRAQAQLEHDGNIGQVIEVSGSVRPMGVEPARIDAHATPRTGEARRRPRWAMRLALGGSVAAAAALALVVTTSLQSKREEDRVAQLAASKSFEIRIQPAPVPQAADEAMRDARKDDAAKAAPVQPKQEEQVAPPEKEPPARLAKKRAEPESMAGAPAAGVAGGLSGLGAAHGARGGSGGDALDRIGDGPAAPPPPAQNAVKPEPRVADAQPTPPATAAAESPPKEQAPLLAEKAHRPATVASQAVSAAPPTAVAAGSMQKAESKLALEEPAENPAELEKQAQEARLAGDRASAAGFYRKAARLRRAAGETSAEAAWDLAHAVECLAAIGQFDEARQVRKELSQLYPSEKSAWSAAGRALREVDPPAAKAKAEPAAVPADF